MFSDNTADNYTSGGILKENLDTLEILFMSRNTPVFKSLSKVVLPMS